MKRHNRYAVLSVWRHKHSLFLVVCRWVWQIHWNSRGLLLLPWCWSNLVSREGCWWIRRLCLVASGGRVSIWCCFSHVHNSSK